MRKGNKLILGGDWPAQKLSLFFTKKCNFSCDYCYLGAKTNQTIKLNKCLKAVDFFLSLPPGDKEITYMGGEPLLETGFLKKSALEIKKMAEKRNSRIELFHVMTNGSLLTPRRLDSLQKLGLSFTVSLDGEEKSNDSHRQEAARVLNNLKGVSLSGFGNSLVFGPDNVSRLSKNVVFMAGLGFSYIYFLPRLYEQWSAKDLKILKQNLAKIKEFYVSLFKNKTKKPFIIPYLYEYFERRNKRSFSCDKLNMDWSGDIYRCWSFLSLADHARKKYRLDLNNFSKSDKIFRKKFFIPAVELFTKLSGQNILESVFCPVDVYVYSVLYEKDREEMMKNFIRINNLYGNFFRSIVKTLSPDEAFARIYGQI